MTLLIVGSQNPVKIQAVRDGATPLLGKIDVQSVDVPSGVRAQPFGEDEMIAGATNRAHAALRTNRAAEFGVGLEGGVSERAEGLFASAWCAIAHTDGQVGLASTGQFMLPPKVAELVRGGMELGHADDFVHGRTNSKHSSGSIGILTHGALNRAQFYTPAVMMALIRFVNAGLFDRAEGVTHVIR